MSSFLSVVRQELGPAKVYLLCAAIALLFVLARYTLEAIFEPLIWKKLNIGALMQLIIVVICLLYVRKYEKNRVKASKGETLLNVNKR